MRSYKIRSAITSQATGPTARRHHTTRACRVPYCAVIMAPTRAACCARTAPCPCGVLFWVALSTSVYFGRESSFTASYGWYTILPASTNAEETQQLTHAWTLVSTFDAYPAWNTFTTSVTTSQPPVPGQPVQLTVELGQPFPLSHFSNSTSKMTLDFYWIEYLPSEHKLCWGIRNNPTSTFPILDIFLTSHRCCELRYQPGVGVQVRHTDLNQGLVAPLVQFSFQTTIEKGFAAMTQDMIRALAKWESAPSKVYAYYRMRMRMHRSRSRNYCTVRSCKTNTTKLDCISSFFFVGRFFWFFA